MGDSSALEKARRELEELYLGVPDDSVNLTFQDLTEVRQQHGEKKRSPPVLEPITEAKSSIPLAKLPSLDFNRSIQAAQASNNHQKHNQNHHVLPLNDRRHHPLDDQNGRGGLFTRHAMENSMGYDEMSHMSGMSLASMNPYQERGGRRRPGIPHSNICTVCSTYIYIFRHRCLVCGRVYCRQCVSIGMGELTEGRKCIECQGRRFSQRYIRKAGKLGCCMGYPSTVKQQELKWAERGPRRSGEHRYGRSGMVSRSRRPVTPPTPTRAHAPNSNPSSFIMSSPYSPYSTTTHSLPL